MPGLWRFRYRRDRRSEMLDQKIDERPRAHGLVALARIVDEQIRRRQHEFGQHHPQPATLQIPGQIPLGVISRTPRFAGKRFLFNRLADACRRQRPDSSCSRHGSRGHSASVLMPSRYPGAHGMPGNPAPMHGTVHAWACGHLHVHQYDVTFEPEPLALVEVDVKALAGSPLCWIAYNSLLRATIAAEGG
ncbi:hypothetical protein OKW41_004960 [Paraburkholderia sp. UCT70]